MARHRTRQRGGGGRGGGREDHSGKARPAKANIGSAANCVKLLGRAGERGTQPPPSPSTPLLTSPHILPYPCGRFGEYRRGDRIIQSSGRGGPRALNLLSGGHYTLLQEAAQEPPGGIVRPPLPATGQRSHNVSIKQENRETRLETQLACIAYTSLPSVSLYYTILTQREPFG